MVSFRVKFKISDEHPRLFHMGVPPRGVIVRSLNLNWQEKQSEVRRNSSKGTYLRISLQLLDNNDVLLLLESIQSSKEGTQKVKAARGLRAVQEHLMYGCGSRM